MTLLEKQAAERCSGGFQQAFCGILLYWSALFLGYFIMTNHALTEILQLQLLLGSSSNEVPPCESRRLIGKLHFLGIDISKFVEVNLETMSANYWSYLCLWQLFSPSCLSLLLGERDFSISLKLVFGAFIEGQPLWSIKPSMKTLHKVFIGAYKNNPQIFSPTKIVMSSYLCFTVSHE